MPKLKTHKAAARRFESRVLHEGPALEGKQRGDSVERGVVGLRGGRIRIVRDEAGGCAEGPGRMAPEVQGFRSQRTMPSALARRYRANSPAAKSASRTGTAWIGRPTSS